MTAEDRYTYKQLTSDSGPLFEEFYGIYRESISTREQKPKAKISEIPARTDYNTLLLLKETGSVIGFSILFTPPKESFCLLEYMAVQSAYRNLGLGRDLFMHTFQDAAKSSSPIYGILEVDSDLEECADREMRRRRQGFYRRLGCLRIDGLSYLLPLRGQGPPPQMDLMIYAPCPVPSISKHQLEAWLKNIYQKVYNCPTDDPRIAQMMESVDDPIRLV